MDTDPVCKMEVDPAAAQWKSEYKAGHIISVPQVVKSHLKKTLKNILDRRFDLPTKLKFDNISASPDL